MPCPTTKPLLSGNTCSACPQDKPNYRSATNQCVAPCLVQETWNNKSGACEKNVCPEQKPFFNTTSLQCQACPNNQVWDTIVNSCRDRLTTGLCPPDKPLYNQKLLSCQACPKNTTYNTETTVCVANCSKGYLYNWDIMNCIPVCLADEYLDNSTLSCVKKCSGIYDAATQKCLSCPNNSTYSSVTGLCETGICPDGTFWNSQKS